MMGKIIQETLLTHTFSIQTIQILWACEVAQALRDWNVGAVWEYLVRREMVWYPPAPHLCLSCKHKLSTHLPFCGSYLPRTVRRVSVGLNIMAIVTNSHSFGSQKEPHDVRVNGNKILFGVLRGGAPGWHPTLDQSKVSEEIGNFYWTQTERSAFSQLKYILWQ